MPAISGKRVRALREKLEWTQAYLAQHANVSQSHLSQIERANVTSVGSVVLTSLATALNTSVDYLIETSDDPRPPRVQAIGKLKPDEEELLKLYRQIRGETFKTKSLDQIRMLLDLDRTVERERRAAARGIPSDEPVALEDRADSAARK